MLTRIFTTTIVLSAAASLVAWVCVVAHARGIRPFRAMARFAQKLSLAGIAAFGLMAAPLYRAGSAKVNGGTNNVPRTSTNTTRTLTVEDFERGFVMARVGTDEAFDFAAPSNATVCADWRAFGAATDWVYMTLTNWAFRVATNDVSRLRIYSFGRIDPLVRDADGTIATNNWFAPFMASLGIVPEANWHLLDETARPSRMWHYEIGRAHV